MSGEDFKLYLDERFGGMTTLFNAHFSTLQDKLESIDEQTKKTNGRVTELEKWRERCAGADDEKNKSFLKRYQTAIFIITLVSVILTGFFGYKRLQAEQVSQRVRNDTVERLLIEQRGGFQPIDNARGVIITDSADSDSILYHE